MFDELELVTPNSGWLDTARELAPAPIDLPAGADLDRRLRRLGVVAGEAAELARLLGAVAEDPLLGWVAERFAAALHREVGRLDLPSPYVDGRRAWPTLPMRFGPAARCVYLPGFLVTVDLIRDEHRRRGIPDEVSWATLADLGRQVSAHRRTFGVAGIDTQWWLMLIWGGALVDLGRLQGEWLDQTSIGLHIPESGSLAPQAIDDSLARARAHWPTWFGATPERATCESWLLDPQLAEVLPATSNIVRFQRRFTLSGEGYVDDQNPLYFVFRRRDVALPAGLAELPGETSLQRAIVDHLAGGGHWRVCQGSLAL